MSGRPVLGGPEHVGWWEMNEPWTPALPNCFLLPKTAHSAGTLGDPGERAVLPTPLHYALQSECGLSGAESSILGQGRCKGEGTGHKGRGITDEAKLILETIKSLKRECVFSRDSESL